MPKTCRIVLYAAVIGLGWTIMAQAGVDLDRWADAIWLAEGCDKECTYLYGIRSVPYIDESEAREICKRTVYNTLIRSRGPRCKPNESDIDCWARRYCPIGSDTDNGTCQYWKKNVLFFLNH